MKLGLTKIRPTDESSPAARPQTAPRVVNLFQ